MTWGPKHIPWCLLFGWSFILLHYVLYPCRTKKWFDLLSSTSEFFPLWTFYFLIFLLKHLTDKADVQGARTFAYGCWCTSTSVPSPGKFTAFWYDEPSKPTCCIGIIDLTELKLVWELEFPKWLGTSFAKMVEKGHVSRWRTPVAPQWHHASCE